MKKIIHVCVILSILLNLLHIPAYASEYNQPENISGTFNSSSERLVADVSFDYSESEFGKTSYSYNHSIAKTSLRLSMAAFAEKTSGYTEQYLNVKNFLEDLKFQNIKWNDNYTEEPTVNSIGVIAGNKKIAFDDGNYTLISLVVRSGEYGAEWGGNFNVGDSDLHEGFRIARDEVLGFLKSYVDENSITGDLKIWLTGYSRGAVVANLTGAYLDKSTEIFGENTNLTADNIYTYCFETPAGVKNPTKDATYDNIFSIVNRNDFVPLVAMEKWGYGRYGRTYYLPTEETNTGYEVLEKNMQNAYNKYVKDNYKITANSQKFAEYGFEIAIPIPYFEINLKKIDNENFEDYKNMGEFLEAVADELATAFESPSEYVNNGQKAMITFGEKIIGQNKTTEFMTAFKDEVMKRATAWNVISAINNSSVTSVNEFLEKIARESVNAAFEKTGVKVEEDVSDIIVSLFINMLNKDQLATLIGNSDIIGEGHYPELCMAWLDAADETEFTNKNKSYVITRGITVTLNGDVVKFDQPPIIKEERTLVPLRAIFEALGATVDWNGDTQTVTSVKGEKTVKLTIGSNILYVNDTPIELDVPAQLVNERTLVPVRAVAESFDCNVDWDGDTQTVIIAE